MANYWKIVNKVINDADILLEVLDARSIEETRNPEIEEKVKERGKLLIFVVNKCDLADKEQIEENIKGLWPCVYVSSTEHLGFRKLWERIII